MRSKTVLSVGLFALLIGPMGAPVRSVAAAEAELSSNNEPFGRFSIDELDAKLKAAKAGRLKLYVYDNNSRERFVQSHVPTARWVDYSRLSPRDLPKERDATLVLYCANEH